MLLPVSKSKACASQDEPVVSRAYAFSLCGGMRDPQKSLRIPHGVGT